LKTRAPRRFFIGRSDAGTIMNDDEAALLRLWREKRAEVEPEDLSDSSWRSSGPPLKTSIGDGMSAIRDAP
jgi:hypothetical protein